MVKSDRPQIFWVMNLITKQGFGSGTAVHTRVSLSIQVLMTLFRKSLLVWNCFIPSYKHSCLLQTNQMHIAL